MILGLTGENCAGKGTIAEYLGKKGFYYLSLSDVIREELAAEGKELSRENLIAKGNSLRTEFGPSILAKKTGLKVQPDKNYVIDSIRNPSEAQELKSLKNFTLVHVTAPPEKRFARMRQRAREGDPKTLDAFIRIEETELKHPDPSHQQLFETFKLADRKLINDSDLKYLYETVDRLLGELSADFKIERPDWDEYFMKIAKVVSMRSNCMKRKVAAIIVRDKRIVSTGYNGTPRGVRNCNEGGCARCNNFAQSGTKLEECLCSHGEENAIVQAAYHGISIKAGVLYTTFAPCLMCTKMIINAGISEVIYNIDYPLNDTALGLLKEAGVAVRQHKVE